MVFLNKEKDINTVIDVDMVPLANEIFLSLNSIEEIKSADLYFCEEDLANATLLSAENFAELQKQYQLKMETAVTINGKESAQGQKTINDIASAIANIHLIEKEELKQEHTIKESSPKRGVKKKTYLSEEAKKYNFVFRKIWCDALDYLYASMPLYFGNKPAYAEYYEKYFSENISDVFSFNETTHQLKKIEDLSESEISKLVEASNNSILTYLPYILYSYLSFTHKDCPQRVYVEDDVEYEKYEAAIKNNENYVKTTIHNYLANAYDEFDKPHLVYTNNIKNFFTSPNYKKSLLTVTAFEDSLAVFKRCMNACFHLSYGVSKKVNYFDSVFLFIYSFSQSHIAWSDDFKEEFSDALHEYLNSETLVKPKEIRTQSPDFFVETLFRL